MRSEERGGGIAAGPAELLVTNSTVSGNSADEGAADANTCALAGVEITPSNGALAGAIQVNTATNWRRP